MNKKLFALTAAALLAAPLFAGAEGWTPLETAPEAPQPPEVAVAEAPQTASPSFNLKTLAALFESAKAARPKADDLIGIWALVAKADEEGAVYNGRGLKEQKLLAFTPKGNPYAAEGTRLAAYIDEGPEASKARKVSFDERSAKVAGWECRQIDGAHLLCRAGEDGETRFEGYLQTKKGQD